MSEDDKTYTEEEFGRVLERAEELASGSDGSAEPSAQLSLTDMKAAAAEAGPDPALIGRAARLTRSSGSLLARSLDWLGWRRLHATFATPLTKERASHVLSSIRAASEQKGEGEATPSGVVWRAGVGRVAVTMHNEGDGSRVQVSANPSSAFFLGGGLGILGGWVTAGSLEPITMGVFFGSVGVGLAVAVGTWAAITGRAKRRVDVLMDAIGRAMADADDQQRIQDRLSGAEPDHQAEAAPRPDGDAS